jgi:hypothetical protein
MGEIKRRGLNLEVHVEFGGTREIWKYTWNLEVHVEFIDKIYELSL